MRKFFRWIFWTALIVLLIRVFILQTYKIDSFTMASTILPGDRVLVNKISTGSRFPNSILGLPGTKRSYFDLFRIPYFRLPGLRGFERNEIIVYNDPRNADKPLDRNPLKVSRLVALPGDTVIILDKELYINRDKVEDPKSLRHLYRVITGGKQIPESFLTEYDIEEPELIASIGIYDYSLDSTAYEAFKAIPEVKTIRQRKLFVGDASNRFFPFSSFFFWNRDQFGPVVVPYKGLEIDISLKNIDLYSDIIDIHEGNELLIDFSGITLNGDKVESYTFKKNYYFVLDDNRDKPEDSRIIGFIPESHILGTSKRIFVSGKSKFEYLDGPRIDRTLKRIK